MDQAKLDSVIQAMRGQGRISWWNVGEPLHPPRRLRYCTECVITDRAEHGEAYWHREHQVPFIWVCPHHAVQLREAVAMPSKNPTLIDAETSISFEGMSQLESEDKDKGAFNVRIAELALALLQRGWLSSQLDLLQPAYLQSLREKGFVLPRSNVMKVTILTRSLVEFYGPQLLRDVKCSFGETRTPPWPPRLVTHQRSSYGSPIQHLLLATFLDIRIHNLQGLAKECIPVDTRIWPCLNPLCPDYLHGVVRQTTSVRIRRMGEWKELDLIACPRCRFIYLREEPVVGMPENPYLLSEILQYGPLWADDSSLPYMLKEPVSLDRDSAIAHPKLEVLANRLDVYLGLDKKRRKSRARADKIVDFENTRQRHRNQVMKALDRDTGLSICDLEGMMPKVVYWLRQWDRDWIKATVPKSPTKRVAKPKRKGRSANWGQREGPLAQAITIAANALYSRSGFPVQVSMSAIERQLGIGDLSRAARHMPKVKDALEKAVESVDSYRDRKVRHIIDVLKEQGVEVNITKVRKLCRINFRKGNRDFIEARLAHYLSLD